MVHMPCAVRMDMHLPSLVNNLQRIIGCLYLCQERRVLAMEGIDAHHNIGFRKKFTLPQQPESHPVLPNDQFRGGEEDLERSARLRSCPAATAVPAAGGSTTAVT